MRSQSPQSIDRARRSGSIEVATIDEPLFAVKLLAPNEPRRRVYCASMRENPLATRASAARSDSLDAPPRPRQGPTAPA